MIIFAYIAYLQCLSPPDQHSLNTIELSTCISYTFYSAAMLVHRLLNVKRMICTRVLLGVQVLTKEIVGFDLIPLTHAG